MRSPAPFGRGVMVTIARLEDSGCTLHDPSNQRVECVARTAQFHVDDVVGR